MMATERDYGAGVVNVLDQYVNMAFAAIIDGNIVRLASLGFRRSGQRSDFAFAGQRTCALRRAEPLLPVGLRHRRRQARLLEQTDRGRLTEAKCISTINVKDSTPPHLEQPGGLSAVSAPRVIGLRCCSEGVAIVGTALPERHVERGNHCTKRCSTFKDKHDFPAFVPLTTAFLVPTAWTEGPRQRPPSILSRSCSADQTLRRPNGETTRRSPFHAQKPEAPVALKSQVLHLGHEVGTRSSTVAARGP